jgi:hypothetical protein
MADDPENDEFPKEIPPPPPWKEEMKVAAWAYRMLRARDNEAEYEHAHGYSGRHDIPGIPVSSINRDMEREAVKRAEVGDLKPLAELLHPDHPMNRHPIGRKTLRESLALETWSLITKKLATGLPKRKKGGQRKTANERRANTRTHDAAEEVTLIDGILRHAYPGQSAEQIRTAACNAVAERWNVSATTLANYFKRGEKRRLPRP